MRRNYNHTSTHNFWMLLKLSRALQILISLSLSFYVSFFILSFTLHLILIPRKIYQFFMSISIIFYYAVRMLYGCGFVCRFALRKIVYIRIKRIFKLHHLFIIYLHFIIHTWQAQKRASTWNDIFKPLVPILSAAYHSRHLFHTFFSLRIFIPTSYLFSCFMPIISRVKSLKRIKGEITENECDFELKRKNPWKKPMITILAENSMKIYILNLVLRN